MEVVGAVVGFGIGTEELSSFGRERHHRHPPSPGRVGDGVGDLLSAPAGQSTKRLEEGGGPHVRCPGHHHGDAGVQKKIERSAHVLGHLVERSHVDGIVGADADEDEIRLGPDRFRHLIFENIFDARARDPESDELDAAVAGRREPSGEQRGVGVGRSQGTDSCGGRVPQHHELQPGPATRRTEGAVELERGRRGQIIPPERHQDLDPKQRDKPNNDQNRREQQPLHEAHDKPPAGAIRMSPLNEVLLVRGLVSGMGAALLALTGCSGEPSSVVTGDSTVISGGRALLGEALRPVDDAVVVVHEGEIVAAGRAEDIDVPAGARRVDASGTTLVPGFIDAHVHIGFAAPRRVLAGGVTTVRDLAWPPRLIWELVERSERDGFDGPSIIAAGQMLTAPGGYPLAAGWAPQETGRPVADPAEASGAVAEQVERGAAVIKIALNPPAGPVLDGATLRAIVTAAHESGRRVTGHVHGLSELRKAVDAGVDELAHMLMSQERIPDSLLELMVRKDMTIVPTLAVRFGRDRRIAIDNTRRFLAAGGRVVYGTDLGNAGPRPGIDPREVKAMTQAGMSPTEIIASATVESARYLGLERSGVLAPGMRADIVALQGDAVATAKALTRVVMVWRDGRLRTP